jgi:hypothetical protein
MGTRDASPAARAARRLVPGPGRRCSALVGRCAVDRAHAASAAVGIACQRILKFQGPATSPPAR